MITKQNNKLIIEINHPCPEDFLKDLKNAIIGAMQHQAYENQETEGIRFINYTLLELMKNLNQDHPE